LFLTNTKIRSFPFEHFCSKLHVDDDFFLRPWGKRSELDWKPGAFVGHILLSMSMQKYVNQKKGVFSSQFPPFPTVTRHPEVRGRLSFLLFCRLATNAISCSIKLSMFYAQIESICTIYQNTLYCNNNKSQALVF
jgi:hypothetical protein